MKILKHLEKSKTFWYVLLILLGFFLLRLPSLIEPNWYGDEGIYQVIGRALWDGRALYSEIWDNKPPLLYITYALVGSDHFSVRLLSLVFGMLATIVFFLLSKKLLQKTAAALAATTAFALLFSTPYLEGNIANAENFILLFTITAGLLVYSYTEKHFSKLSAPRSLLVAGFLLGVAFLFKIVAVFDFAAFTIFLILVHLPTHFSLKVATLPRLFNHYSFLFPYFVGFVVPIFVTFLYFIIQNNLTSFIQGAFLGNVGYVEYGNTFFIPQGFLILKLLFFCSVLALVITKRHKLAKPILFIVLWLLFAVFSAFFSQRPYTHYLLVLLPAFCLLIGLLFAKQARMFRIGVSFLIILLCTLAINYFHVFGIQKTVAYYQNVLGFLNGNVSVQKYQAFFDPETPRDYELVTYIESNTKPSDIIFIWGDSPQIYTMANKLPINQYTTAYHIIESESRIVETQAAIDKIQPKFIITLSEAPPIPFHLPGYTGRHGIEGAAIYERTY